MVVHWIAEVFAVGDRAGWNLVEWVAGLSTERAQEMQKRSGVKEAGSVPGVGAGARENLRAGFVVTNRTPVRWEQW